VGAMQKWGWTTIFFGIAAVLIILWLIKAPIISSYLSQSLGMRVSVASVKIRPSQMTLGYFKIVNPHKYQGQYALKAASIRSSYQWKELRDRPSVIDQIEIDRIYLRIEFDNASGTKNNWTDLISQIPEKKENAKEVIVRKLILTNMTVDIQGKGMWVKKQTRTIDRMEFTNVSSEEGFPTRELISQIFGDANLFDYIKEIVPGGPGGIIKKMIPFTLLNEKGQENPGPSIRQNF
jgi:hypothetical protein